MSFTTYRINTLQIMKETVLPDLRFAEWLGENYTRKNGGWYHKHDPATHRTTAELYVLFKAGLQGIESRLIDIIVCEYLNLPYYRLRQRSRKKEVVRARQLAMYFYDRETALTLEEIGAELGGFDRATVLHAKKTVENDRETNLHFRKIFNDIENIVNAQKFNKKL